MKSREIKGRREQIKNRDGWRIQSGKQGTHQFINGSKCEVTHRKKWVVNLKYWATAVPWEISGFLIIIELIRQNCDHVKYCVVFVLSPSARLIAVTRPNYWRDVLGPLESALVLSSVPRLAQNSFICVLTTFVLCAIPTANGKFLQVGLEMMTSSYWTKFIHVVYSYLLRKLKLIVCARESSNNL